MNKITDLTNEEIVILIDELFKPKKISEIKVDGNKEEISCYLMLDWQDLDDNNLTLLTKDKLVLRNPFRFNKEKAIDIDTNIYEETYRHYQIYCLSKGINQTQ